MRQIFGSGIVSDTLEASPAILVVEVERRAEASISKVGKVSQLIDVKILLYPRTFSMQAFCPNLRTSDSEYQLCAVIASTGKTVDNNKFVAIVKNCSYEVNGHPSDSNASFELFRNDGHVTGVSESTALSCTGEFLHENGDVFLATTLFYVNIHHLEKNGLTAVDQIMIGNIRKEMDMYKNVRVSNQPRKTRSK